MWPVRLVSGIFQYIGVLIDLVISVKFMVLQADAF